MNISKFIKEKQAVSPVIGVILMVAITVILAAVIGTFVLGLGDQVGDTAPNAQWDTESEITDENIGGNSTGIEVTVTFTHEGGDPVEGDSLSGSFDGTVDSEDYSGIDDTTEYAAGDSIDFVFQTADDPSANVEGTVNLLWESGDRSSVLRSFDVNEENPNT